jgi:aspartate ammonia-lyase
VTTRTEHDLLGVKDVPAEAYWGVHTARALENFSITGMPISAYPHLVDALAAVKAAAAQANAELGLLPPRIADAIVTACTAIRRGALHEQFVVDVIQGGAGTSTNMNANEVIANLALELLWHAKGDYAHIHPNEHVNLSQSTNDAYPTAVNIATITAVRALAEAMAGLERTFAAKAVEFREVLKMGRTQLQDAVPMTLGQEFGTYAVMLGEDRLRLEEAVALLHEINLGATAIGTGLNAPPGYAQAACRHLVEITGLPLTTSPDLVEATQDCGAFVHLSGVLKRIAVKLSKICNDLRLLSSGPRAGLGEINLPPVQAGSSIMAREDQPGDSRGGQPGGLRGDRQRRDDHHGRRGRAAAAQRVRADHPALAVEEHHPPDLGLPGARRALRHRDHRERRRRARVRGELHRPGHRAQPGHRLRRRHGDRQGGPGHRPWRRRARARPQPDPGVAARRDAPPGEPGDPSGGLTELLLSGSSGSRRTR